MIELSDCLTAEELEELEDLLPSGLAERIARAMVQEDHFKQLGVETTRNPRVQVPVNLQRNPGDIREERVVDRDLARLLLKAAECFANASEI